MNLDYDPCAGDEDDQMGVASSTHLAPEEGERASSPLHDPNDNDRGAFCSFQPVSEERAVPASCDLDVIEVAEESSSSTSQPVPKDAAKG